MFRSERNRLLLCNQQSQQTPYIDLYPTPNKADSARRINLNSNKRSKLVHETGEKDSINYNSNNFNNNQFFEQINSTENYTAQSLSEEERSLPNSDRSEESIYWNSMHLYISFNLKEIIESALRVKYNLTSRVNYDEELYEGAVISKKEFLFKFRSLVAFADMTNDAANQLKSLLQDCMPENKYIDFNAFISDTPEESKYKPIILLFHCCLCGATVYQGNNSAFESCTKCGRSRYTDRSKRYPVATINYRPITTIICELLESTVFENAIQFGNTDIIDDENVYSDIMNTQYSKELMNDMHNQFQNKHNNNEFQGHNVKGVSLLLGLSYDGAQIYSHATSNFWPMFISILNLPPELRKTLGKGTFMVALYTSKPGAIAEQFIFHKCLVDELKILNEGVSIVINNQAYHIQARLRIIGVDTKALEAITNTQGPSSYAGCPLCRLCQGLEVTSHHNIIHSGERM